MPDHRAASRHMPSGVVAGNRPAAAGPVSETVVRGLSDLAVRAPAALLPRVLVATGLADGYAQAEAPIGPVFVAFSDRGVSALALAGDPAGFERWFTTEIGRRVVRVAELPPSLGAPVRRRLDGDRSTRVPFDLRGRSDFEQAVLEKALEIPRGEVRPYAWIAAEIGRPKAVRAVGSALAHNPVPLLIPCHRIVRSDGLIGNYSLGGPSVKRRVLSIEGLDVDGLESLARKGVRLVGSDTTRVFCLPACHHVRRVSPAHLVRFRSHAEASRSGYRPCRTCRPVPAAA